MQNLYKKGKVEKADGLKLLLQQFARAHGAGESAFEQLPELKKLVHMRNQLLYPCDEAYVIGEIEKGNPDLSSTSLVLELLLSAKAHRGPSLRPGA